MVAVVWYFNFPGERRAPVPFLRIEEANPRAPAVNRVTICELECEIHEDDRQMRTYIAPLLPTYTYEIFT